MVIEGTGVTRSPKQSCDYECVRVHVCVCVYVHRRYNSRLGEWSGSTDRWEIDKQILFRIKTRGGIKNI